MKTETSEDAPPKIGPGQPLPIITPMVTLFKLNNHKISPTEDLLDIVVADQPGAGGAHHEYLLYWPEQNNRMGFAKVLFQNGPIKEHGLNGVTNEALLAIVQHRLMCFQAGDFACGENQSALEHVGAALQTLKGRTWARMQRGVEGTMQK